MVDYYTQTVVSTLIPDVDMTPIEKFLLQHMFQSEQVGDRTYFYAHDGQNLEVAVSVEKLNSLLDESKAIPTEIFTDIAEFLLEEVEEGAETVVLNFDEFISAEEIFQDIIIRSEILKYVVIETSFTCSKMRADGFGGAATFITEDNVQYVSTADFIARCINDFEKSKKENPS